MGTACGLLVLLLFGLVLLWPGVVVAWCCFCGLVLLFPGVVVVACCGIFSLWPGVIVAW